ncbi:MAG: RHS repeat-associated core domain-containing protein [Candidatus Electrothrix sp. GW3-4]|uniref:RHS repeat domain-containing protein n=1 Tax=Candidatus Electrothrix sp. GW3-4 TaxID=3126740 RepID=UPI0030CC73EC
MPVAPLEATVAVNEPSTKEAPEPVLADNPPAVAATSMPSDTAFLQPIFFLLLLQNKSAEGAYYYINDHLGAPQIITDDSGSIVWQAEYLPFGKVNISVAQIENNLRFPGQYFDAETGLHYNWNRYYDPETGRYIAADPIGLDGGMNLYAYVGSDPVNGVDPMGLQIALPVPVAPPGGISSEMSKWNAKAAEALSDAINDAEFALYEWLRQREYRRYKDRCGQKPPAGLEHCEKLNWLLDQAENCRDLRQRWDDRWEPGRHKQAISDWNNRANKLRRKIARECCEQ